MARGSFGRTRAFQDFLNTFEDVTWASTSVDLGEGWFMVSVNEGTLNDVTDESGGVQQFLTDTGSADNVVLASGLYRPADGELNTESRFKVADDILNTAIYAGFTETLALDTPVMPAEFSTTTMTHNGTGGMTGFNWDSDATDNDFRALMGDAGAAAASSGDGTRLDKGAWVVNEYAVLQVALGPSGSGICRAGLTDGNELSIVQTYTEGLTNTDLFYAILMCETRTGAALEFEVDYVYASGGRNWTV
jgi:hypothetical protein